MSNDGSVYGGNFCTADENQICTIGTGYIANYVSEGNVKRAGATLTNKRIYFCGSVYMRDGRGRFVSVRQRKIVNVRDVTGTGYEFYRPIYLMIWAIVSVVISVLSMMVCSVATVSSAVLSPYASQPQGGSEVMSQISMLISIVCFILFITFLIAYFMKRLTLLSIEYAGGNIAFDVKWIQQHEQDYFLHIIHLVKDNLYSKAAELQGFAAPGGAFGFMSQATTTVVDNAG